MTNILETKYPLIQGALAQISTPPLVIAVAKAGGLGVLTTAGLTSEQLAQRVAEIRAATDQPFAVNLMLQQPNIVDMVTYLLAHPVPVVTTSAGSPKRFAQQLQAVGTKVIAVIPNVKVAQKMAALGVDALVAEGLESGGHIGTQTTLALVQQVVAAVDLPVFAAGGIYDAHSVQAMQALGAVGVQVGTAFLAAEETPISSAYKQAVIQASDTSTVVTGRALGDAVRCLQNPLTTRYFEAEQAGADVKVLHGILDGSLRRAIVGDIDHGTLMAGQIAGMVKRIEPVAAIVSRLFAN
ncbi:NAD(P)H-dependent flavin oxidoreductase [Lacticaseibacillus sp. N501-2]|uniref:NAD(P)H-dependent flavin oxidoreductase n=1 Tax=Lacticaseibacillus salsurae TaxID=3367729 RepID=UPI0038B2FC48